MAEALLEDQDTFRCSICLDPLRDPATIPCGHSYCMKCISGFWDQRGECSCPQCRETFTTRPVLKKNTILAELVEKMKKISESTASPTPPAQCAEVGNVECDFCTETKLKAVKSCLVCLVSLCQTHVEPHNSIPALKNHKLVQASMHLEEKICSQHNKLIEVFCRVDQECICMLCSMDNHKGHDTVSAASERKEKEKELGETKIQFLERIQKREKELQQIQETLSSYQRSAKEAEQQSEKIFTELLESIERRRSEVKELIRAQQKAAMRDAEDVLEKLEQELAELRRGHAQLEKLSLEEDHVLYLQVALPMV
ncbi:E3 ubiquitin-protein ligase TRIM47-like [Engraulis encrasicolus]|uniref:E3 ubiquitin-protein ligase TRIM47-like n=1 Tax=Engraulis encrasicolus TaxID=184585 RepID=UPI002FCE846E